MSKIIFRSELKSKNFRFLLLGGVLLFLAASFSTEVSRTDRWLSQQSPTAKNLRSIFFTDTLTGWIGGDSGLILKTTNGGINWVRQETGLNTTVYSLFFTTADTGYALAWQLDNTPPNYYGTRYLQTTNGGSNWTNILFPDSNYFANSIYFYNNTNGFICGTQGKIYFSTDAGYNWNLSVIDSGIPFGFPVEDVAFFNENSGYAVGGAIDIAGVIWKSTNGGRNWRTTVVGPEPVNDVHIINDSTAIAVGGDFEYGSSKVYTENEGSKWEYTEFGIFGIANTIAYRTESEAWISLGIIDSFLVSTDGGNDWHTAPVPKQGRVYGIAFPNFRNGWAIGNDGLLLKYNADIISVEDIGNEIPSSSELLQNFPNPFNPQTKISYKLNTVGEVRLCVYDLAGRIVAELVNARQSAGEHSVDFAGDGLAGGAYVYSLEVNGVMIESKKMVYLK